MNKIGHPNSATVISGPQFEIFDSVVEPVAVPMMDGFVCGYWTPKVEAHNMPVLAHFNPINGGTPIPVLIDVSNSPSRGIARLRAKPPRDNLGRVQHDFLAATFARKLPLRRFAFSGKCRARLTAKLARVHRLTRGESAKFVSAALTGDEHHARRVPRSSSTILYASFKAVFFGSFRHSASPGIVHCFDEPMVGRGFVGGFSCAYRTDACA